MLARVLDFEDRPRRTSESTLVYERTYSVRVLGLTVEASLRSGLTETTTDILVPVCDEQGRRKPAEPCPVAKGSVIHVSTPQRLSYGVEATVVLGRLTVQLHPQGHRSFTALGIWPAPDH